MRRGLGTATASTLVWPIRWPTRSGPSGLLRSAGDVWSWLLDTNRQRVRHGLPPVVGRGPLGPGPLFGCLVPGHQTPPQRGVGRVPTSQAPARPDPLLPRHVLVPARTGEVAGRQRPSRVVGAAGPPHTRPLPTRQPC